MIHGALDAGDFYGKMLIIEALKGRRRDQAVLSVELGALRDPAAADKGPSLEHTPTER
jgi:pyridoxine 4-dehydrogenase